jgi:hypothetical protein
MAGDIGRRERLILLPDGAEQAGATERARPRLDDAGACTTHEYGGRVVIVDLPAEAEASVNDALDGLAASAPTSSVSSLATETVEELDDAASLGLSAFGLRSSDDYVAAKSRRPHAEEAWDRGGEDVLPPDPPRELRDDIEGPSAHDEPGPNGSSSPTSARLTGSVAVGVIIVEGPTAALRFSQAERVKVVAEVQNGLAWLGAQSSPQGITWSYDVRVVTITAQPSSNDTTLAQREARFRDPALAAMGYGSGLNGARAYVNALRAVRKTNWGYCAFFTKYPVGHFAYASLGGPRLVMHYENDGWGPDNIDRVFAHETGHIFNAPDEYAASGCNCGGQWGHFKVANSNCDPCSGTAAVECLMKANTWAMCSHTPYHLGFPQGARYTGVFTSGSGAHAFWTNASWQPFVAKWQQLSGQGLRLMDLDVSQVGTQLRYSGAFRAGSGPYGLWALADQASFVERWQQWSQQGMRLVDVEVTPVSNQVRYSGVFAQGAGSYGLWLDATWESFVPRWQQWSQQGLRLVDLSVRMVGSTPRYSGVFRAGSGPYGLWALATWASFRDRWQQWSQQGLRLVDVERTMVGNQARYSGVFVQGTGGYGLSANSSWQDFRRRWEQWSANGLRLVDISMEPTGIEQFTSPEPGAVSGDGVAPASGLLGFGGAPIALGMEDGPTIVGQGAEDLSPPTEDHEPAMGTGMVEFDETGTPGGDGATASPLPSADTAVPSSDGEGPPTHTGVGGASFDGTTTVTAPPPRDAGAVGTVGQGGAVLDLEQEAEVPEGSGLGGASSGD